MPLGTMSFPFIINFLNNDDDSENPTVCRCHFFIIFVDILN